MFSPLVACVVVGSLAGANAALYGWSDPMERPPQLADIGPNADVVRASGGAKVMIVFSKWSKMVVNKNENSSTLHTR
jgi:hypothetical protein